MPFWKLIYDPKVYKLTFVSTALNITNLYKRLMSKTYFIFQHDIYIVHLLLHDEST